MKNWIQISLSREMEMDDRVKLSILANCIDKDNLGLYCRYFMVTHRFLTTVNHAYPNYIKLSLKAFQTFILTFRLVELW